MLNITIRRRLSIVQLDYLIPTRGILVSVDLQSNQNKDQEYAYLVQIQNDDGVTVLLSWIAGTLPADHSSSPSQSWTPIETGEYTITVFVWNSLANPTALSESMSKTIMVS